MLNSYDPELGAWWMGWGGSSYDMFVVPPRESVTLRVVQGVRTDDLGAVLRLKASAEVSGVTAKDRYLNWVCPIVLRQTG